MNDVTGMLEAVKNVEPIFLDQQEKEDELQHDMTMAQTMQVGLLNQEPAGQEQMEKESEMLLGEKQETDTTQKLGIVMHETVRAAQPEAETDELAGQLRNESRLAKKNRQSKTKNAKEKHKTVETTTRELEGLYKNTQGQPLTPVQEKGITSKEKELLMSKLAAIEAKAAADLAAMESKKKHNNDEETRRGITLDADTMSLNAQSLTEQIEAWTDYGQQQKLGEVEKNRVDAKIKTLNDKKADIEKTKENILTERHKQNWIKDENISKMGFPISTLKEKHNDGWE